MSVSGSPQRPQQRQKRSQVVRACDFCRQHRVKCDNNTPCSNCRNKGERCSNAAINSLTLPHALREIEHLRRTVQDLERDLQQERTKSTQEQDGRRSPPTPPSSAGTLSIQAIDSRHENPPQVWEGIHVRTARSTSETWYGASSLFYFIGRVSSFLSSTLEHTSSADQMLGANPASTLLDGPASSASASHYDSQSPQQANDEELISAAEGGYLTPVQEEYFLDLYWQSVHTALLPILNESAFKAHYRSLWTTGGNTRKPSALVDIVVALCMQHGISMVPAARPQLSEDSSNEANVAGRWYYVRCQRLLAYELESPTISTLQCQLLCCVYLCCGTFQNMLDSVCSTASRTAYMLGLHLDPPDTMPQQERETRRRLWWALYVMDSRIGMKLGRPFLLNPPCPSPRFPDHRLEIAMQSGSNFAPLGDDLSWLSFNLEHIKLFVAARAVHTAFYCRELSLRGRTMWDDPAALESQADFLQSSMKELEQWVNHVPPVLQTKRISNARPFSTDESALDIEQFAPLWLQRQRILLELMYHNLCVNLYRPFICFGTERTAPRARLAAEKCAHHAMALTNITHQVLSSTPILTGWHEAFQWQWNAAMTLVGFVLADPRDPSTAAARKSVDRSVAVLDMFGNSFAVGNNAANIVRQVLAKIELLVRQSPEQRPAAEEDKTAEKATFAACLEQYPLKQMPNHATATKPMDSAARIGGDMTPYALQDAFNMAFDIDQWTDLNMLWPSTVDMMLDH